MAKPIWQIAYLSALQSTLQSTKYIGTLVQWYIAKYKVHCKVHFLMIFLLGRKCREGLHHLLLINMMFSQNYLHIPFLFSMPTILGNCASHINLYQKVGFRGGGIDLWKFDR